MTLKAILHHSQTSVLITVLVDSGAAINLLDHRLTEELHLLLQPSTEPLRLMAINNRHIREGLITHHTALLMLQISALHFEEVTFYILSTPSNPIILGFPWLQRQNPVMSWKEGKLVCWSPYCLNHCLQNIESIPCQKTIINARFPVRTRILWRSSAWNEPCSYLCIDHGTELLNCYPMPCPQRAGSTRSLSPNHGNGGVYKLTR